MRVRSSEQVAFEAYRGLPAEERHLVDAWRALGRDYTSALLAAGVLGRGRRRHPSEVRLPLVAHQQQRALGSAQRTFRKVCEHEAAHAVVARALGLQVGRVTVDADGSGVSLVARSADDKIANLAMSVAPEVWFALHRTAEFPEGEAASAVCLDRRDQIFGGGDNFNMRMARRRANDALQNNRAAVLALADQLEQHGSVDLSDPD